MLSSGHAITENKNKNQVNLKIPDQLGALVHPSFPKYNLLRHVSQTKKIDSNFVSLILAHEFLGFQLNLMNLRHELNFRTELLNQGFYSKKKKTKMFKLEYKV